MSLDFELGQLNDFFPLLLVAAVISLAMLWLAWSLKIGFTRGSLAALCRIGWLLPLFISFFPKTTTEQLPRTLALTPVHILIDDSQSMLNPRRLEENSRPAPYSHAEELVRGLNEECARLGCMPRITKLSEQDPGILDGYTPLNSVLEAWIYKVGADPWLLISDGSDQSPTERWSGSLKNTGRSLVPTAVQPVDTGAAAARGEPPRGMIVGFLPQNADNIWIKDFNVPPFSFEDKPLTIDVALQRGRKKHGTERVQIQIMSGAQSLATVNASFDPDALETQVTATIPPLPRGQHLLTVRALPTAEETALWDNAVHAQIEVMPNTVGVLHLLGSPSWDGRFLRRYLKAEPKYDLISFFILRDPWDSQQVSERELSLIPFPVERLFREELPNFRVVVIQNFTLFQFLLPEYQENLVRFVQEGGGLLFLGGPRALQSADLSSSPLREILPFEVTAEQTVGSGLSLDLLEDMMPGQQEPDDKGPAYDGSLPFKVELAQPEAHKRALANVYDDWETLAAGLGAWSTARGLHRMDRVKLKADTTPLLVAKPSEPQQSDRDGRRLLDRPGQMPLAVASYPGKGRAIWLFTDSLWRLGQTVSDQSSRQVYNQFMHAAMTWLMRQDMRQPLVAKNLSLRSGREGPSTWRVTIQGPAARYFEPSSEWTLKVCGTPVAASKLMVTKSGAEEWELAGPLATRLAGGERCHLTIEGEHAAFGSVKAQVAAVFPEVFKDEELDGAPQKLEDLAELTGAGLYFIGEDGSDNGLPAGSVAAAKEALLPWLERSVGSNGVALPDRFKTLRDFYWVIDTPWFWLLMLLMPLEVLVRRWDQIFAGSLGHTEKS